MTDKTFADVDVIAEIIRANRSDGAGLLAEKIQAAISRKQQQKMLDAMYTAWHEMGIDILGGSWSQFIEKLSNLQISKDRM